MVNVSLKYTVRNKINNLVTSQENRNMKPNIFKSRKFWIAVVDAFTGLLALWVTQFIPEYKELIIQTWAFLQLPVGVLIASIAYEDAAAMKSGYAAKPPQE